MNSKLKNWMCGYKTPFHKSDHKFIAITKNYCVAILYSYPMISSECYS